MAPLPSTMSTLLKAITSIFSRQLIVHTASRLGESERAVRKALGDYIGLVLNGLAEKSAADAQWVHEMSQRAYLSSGNSLGSMTGLLGVMGSGHAEGTAMAEGKILLTALFGDAEQSRIDVVAFNASIKPTSADTLLVFIGAVLPMVLGQHISRHEVSLAATTTMLASATSGQRIVLAEARLPTNSVQFLVIPDKAQLGAPLRYSRALGFVLALLMWSILMQDTFNPKPVSVALASSSQAPKLAPLPQAGAVSTALNYQFGKIYFAY
jgi:hypothetical protein